MQQVGPFSFHLCLSDFKVWPQDLPGTFTGAQGVVLLLMASFRLSQYFKSHISCEGCTVCLSWPDEVSVSPEDSLEVPPVEQQGLWVTWHCPNHFLEMFLVGWFAHLLWRCPGLWPYTFSVSRDCCWCWSHPSGWASLSCPSGSGLSSRYRIPAWNSPRAEKEAAPPVACGQPGQRLAPWVRLLLAGGVHWALGGSGGRGALSHAPVFASGCLVSPWSHNKIMVKNMMIKVNHLSLMNFVSSSSSLVGSVSHSAVLMLQAQVCHNGYKPRTVLKCIVHKHAVQGMHVAKGKLAPLTGIKLLSICRMSQ